MPWRLATSARNAAGDALLNLLDNGGTATLMIYSGEQPDDPNDAPTGELLATLSFSAESFNAFVAGVSTSNVIASDDSVSEGTAGWVRLINGDGTTHSDMDIAQNSGTLSFDTIDFETGGSASLEPMTITFPVEMPTDE